MGTLRGRILVIDNDPGFCAFMAALLHDEGHQVQTATSVAAARAHLAAQRPDLIISDLLVWGMAPQDVPGLLTTDAQTRDVPILLCTGAAREVEAMEALLASLRQAGRMDVLLKPFDLTDLLDRIARLLDRRGDRERGGCGAT